MKGKLFLLIALAACASILASCSSASPAAAPATSAPSVSEPATAAASSPTAAAAQSPEASAAPTVPAIIREDTGIASPADVRDAYVKSLTARPDGQADIAFDFVDWLTGDAAKAQYALDHPGATDDDMDNANIFEVGYIRNISPAAFTYHTGPDTQYFLPGSDDSSTNVQVDFTAFCSRMTAALAGGPTANLTFVKISADGDTIVKIEWNYLP